MSSTAGRHRLSAGDGASGTRYGHRPQNGNAYEEGLGDAWAPVRRYWEKPTAELRETLRRELGPQGLRWQWVVSAPDPDSIAPEGYTLDAAMIARPGNMDIQLDLFLDYANNVKLYPAFQEYFRKSQPPLLAIRGKNDPFFVPAGAQAFTRVDSISKDRRSFRLVKIAIRWLILYVASCLLFGGGQRVFSSRLLRSVKIDSCVRLNAI
jgi:hypothetical protein